MILRYTVFSATLVLAACRTETTNTPAAPATPPSPVQTEAVVNSPLPFFSGKGQEPGWSIEIDAAPDGRFPFRLQTAEEGEIRGSLQKEALMVDNKPNVKSGEVKLSGRSDSGKLVVISLMAGECTAASGKNETHSIAVQIDNSKLSGCGHYAE